MLKKRVIEIITSLLIILFVYAALTKLFDYYNFKTQLGKSPFLTFMSGFAAWSIPASELIVVGLLSFKRTRELGLYASLFLMTLFTAYIYAMLNFSYYVPCSCGGILSEMEWSQHFIFNIFFVVISITGIVLQSKESLVGSKAVLSPHLSPANS